MERRDGFGARHLRNGARGYRSRLAGKSDHGCRTGLLIGRGVRETAVEVLEDVKTLIEIVRMSMRTGQATSRVLVAGVLGGESSRRAAGMTIAVRRGEEGANTTECCWPLPDQTALMGVLDTLDSHGARLLSVESIAVGASSAVLDKETDG